jgi:glycosyltransferase involved in cell wall biosynthesis
MACGRPCVVTDVGDARRIVGDTSYVVVSGNPAALALAWQEALDAGVDEQAKQGQRARERIIQYFSLERLIEETALVLEAAIEAREQRTR